MLGGLVSLTVIVCVQVALVAALVRRPVSAAMINCPTQLLELIASPCQLTVTAPPASVARRHAVGVRNRHLAGAAHGPNWSGQVMLGGLVSLTVIVCVQVALFTRTDPSPGKRG